MRTEHYLFHVLGISPKRAAEDVLKPYDSLLATVRILLIIYISSSGLVTSVGEERAEFSAIDY